MPPEAATEDTLEIEVIDTPSEVEDEAAEGDAQESSPEAVRIASLMGWKDPKGWKGDPPPGGLKSAEEFLADVPQVTKGLRQKADRLEGQVTRIVAQVARLDRRASTQELDAAKVAAKEAFDAGDFDAAEKILLGAGRSAPTNDEPPAVEEFRERNEWFGVDQEATDYVTFLDRKYVAEAGGPDKVGDAGAHMRRIEATVKKRFPELFEAGKGPKDGDEDDDGKPAARRAPLVQRGGRVDRQQRGAGPITAADLTPTQRKACVTMGVSEKDYVKSFNDLNKAS